MIDLRLMQQYIAVAETLNFRRAAQKLNMAQPPLSAAIRRLEEQLGVILLERNNRSTRLTPAGAVFLAEARRTLEQASHACTSARRAAAGLSGSLRLGFVDSQAASFLPLLLSRYQANYPSVDIQLIEATPPEQLRKLEQDDIDVGLLVLPIAIENQVQLQPLFEDQLIAVLPPNHHLAGKPALALSDLAEDPWVLFAPHDGPGMHARIQQSCAQAGFIPRVVQRPRQMHTTAGLVSGGLGVALMPRIYAKRYSSELACCEIVGPGTPISYSLALAYRDLSPCVSALRNEALKILDEPLPQPSAPQIKPGYIE